jgi:hypothetical protein
LDDRIVSQGREQVAITAKVTDDETTVKTSNVSKAE